MPNTQLDSELNDFFIIEESHQSAAVLNPYDNLQQVAEQLTLYLNVIDLQEIINIIQQTRANSSLKKAKKNEIDRILKEMTNAKEPKYVINLLVTNNQDEWTDTSFNTCLLRRLVKALPDYDPNINLSSDLVFRLSRLLLVSIYENVKNQKKLDELETKINAFKLEQERMEEELAVKKKECSQKNAELVEYESKIAELANQKEKTANDIQLDMKKLVDLAEQATQKEAELKNIQQKIQENAIILERKKSLFSFNPGAFDVGSLSAEKIEEAIKVAEIAFKLSISEENAKTNKKNELKQMEKSGAVSKAKKSVATMFEEQNRMMLRQNKADELQQELSTLTNRPRPATDFKEKLSMTLFGKTDSRLTSMFKNGMNSKVNIPLGNVTICENYTVNTKTQSAPAKQSAISLSDRKIKPTSSKNPNFLTALNAVGNSLFPSEKSQENEKEKDQTLSIQKPPSSCAMN